MHTEIFDPPHIPDTSTMRDYQLECLDAIERAGAGNHLCVLATGLGKTYIFSHIPRRGRVLILSHRDELVRQPEKYYDCSFGIEKANEHSDGEEVVSASVQTIIKRLDNFDPYDFDMIITDEAHHAVAASYKKIYNYFKPRVHIGFTATPNRDDKKGLKEIYDDIVYNKDLKFGISNKYLCDINCLRVNVGFNLSKVKKQMGDFNIKDLGNEMEKEEVVDAVAEAYYKYAHGATVIFATNVNHANRIAQKIEDAVVVTGDTQNRETIIEKFTKREIPCLINCMVFTEGTDIPLIETVIIARPTHNQSLYAQMVGRGLRLYEGKKELTLIDCIGVTGKMNICTAPNLFGIDTNTVSPDKLSELQGSLLEMEKIVEKNANMLKTWIVSAEKVQLFQREEGIEIGNDNYIQLPNGTIKLYAGKGIEIEIPQSDARGETKAYIYKERKLVVESEQCDKQAVIEAVHDWLDTNCSDTRNLWDKKSAGWGNQKISPKQINYIKSLLFKIGQHYDEQQLLKMNKRQASVIIEQLKYKLVQE